MCCEKHVLQVIALEYNCVGQNKNDLKIIEFFSELLQNYFIILPYHYYYRNNLSEIIETLRII